MVSTIEKKLILLEREDREAVRQGRARCVKTRPPEGAPDRRQDDNVNRASRNKTYPSECTRHIPSTSYRNNNALLLNIMQEAHTYVIYKIHV